MNIEQMRELAQLLVVDQAGLDQHIDGDAAWVRTWLAEEPRDTYRPMLSIQVVKEPGGKVETVLAVIDTNFNEAEEKSAILYGLGRRINEDRLWPVSVVLSSEAWSAPEASSSGVQPRHHPERRESIILFGSTLIERRSAVRLIEVSRGPGNVIVPSAETVGADARSSSSPPLMQFFAGFFEDAAKMANRGGQ